MLSRSSVLSDQCLHMWVDSHKLRSVPPFLYMTISFSSTAE